MVIYAEDRSCTTQFELGKLYDQQEADYEQAFHWYRKAARKGSRQAQHRLASMYARGRGTEQDFARAYAWCKVAVFQNSRRARRKLSIIEPYLNLQQLRRGRWLAQEYYDRYVVHCSSTG